MSRRISLFVPAIALLLAGDTVWAQAVSFGTITAVSLVKDRSRGAQTRGAILGGALGAIATSGASGPARAVGTTGGVIAGQRLGRQSGTRQAFEYTIRINDRQTIRMVTDEAGMRIGDCVAVERGGFNNLRLVDDAHCGRNISPTPAEINSARVCMKAKEQLLAAATDQEFDRAERSVRLLCLD